MSEISTHWEPVSAESADVGQLQKAAALVEQWLAESEGTKDKPFEEILDPNYNGVFLFALTDEGGVDYESGPLAFVAERFISPAAQVWNPVHPDRHLKSVPELHEISSLIVNPSWQGQGIGGELIEQYKGYLLDLFGEQIDLVAIAHVNGSSSVFAKAGFSEVTSVWTEQTVDTDPGAMENAKNLQKRIADGQAAGKIIMAYSLSNS